MEKGGGMITEKLKTPVSFLKPDRSILGTLSLGVLNSHYPANFAD
jgi:hypothetical protein